MLQHPHTWGRGATAHQGRAHALETITAPPTDIVSARAEICFQVQSRLWNMGSWCLHCTWDPRGGWACSRPGAASRGATAPKWLDTCAAHVPCQMARIRCECAVEHSAETARARSSRPAGSAAQAQLVHIAKAWARSTDARGSSARAVESLQSAEIASDLSLLAEAKLLRRASICRHCSICRVATESNEALRDGRSMSGILFYTHLILFNQVSTLSGAVKRYVSVWALGKSL